MTKSSSVCPCPSSKVSESQILIEVRLFIHICSQDFLSNRQKLDRLFGFWSWQLSCVEKGGWEGSERPQHRLTVNIVRKVLVRPERSQEANRPNIHRRLG